MDLYKVPIINTIWTYGALIITLTNGVVYSDSIELIYGQWTFSIYKKPATWNQAAAKCRHHSGKLLEPRGEQGHAVTSLLLVNKPIDYNVWIGMWHNTTVWNFSDTNINETYDEAESAWHPDGRSMLGISNSKLSVNKPAGTTIAGKESSSMQNRGGSSSVTFQPSVCATISTKDEKSQGWHARACSEKHTFICEYSASECDRRNPDVNYGKGEDKKCFQFVFEQLDWFQARRYCQGNHSRLAVVDEQNMHRQLSKYVHDEGKQRPALIGQHWFGLSQLRWRWQNDEAVEEDNWGLGEPRSEEGACVSVAHNGTRKYVWRNRQCNETLPFICVSKLIKPEPRKVRPGGAICMPNLLLQSEGEGKQMTCTCANKTRLFDFYYLLEIWENVSLYGLLINAAYIAIGFGAGTLVTTLVAIPCCCCCRSKRKARELKAYGSVWNNPACLSITEEPGPGEPPRYPGQPRPGMEGAAGYSAPLPSAPYEHMYESPYACIPGASDTMPRSQRFA